MVMVNGHTKIYGKWQYQFVNEQISYLHQAETSATLTAAEGLHFLAAVK